MKIAYIYDAIYPDTIGGVEKRIHEIGIRLHGMGHEVHLYGMKYWNGPDIIVREGLIIHGVCPQLGLYTEGRRSVYQAIRYTLGLIRHVISADLDIIDCQNFPYFPAIVTYPISRFKGETLVITWHEFWGDYWYSYLGKKGIFGLIIERISLWCSRSALAVSPLTANQMRQAGYQGVIEISPNGIHIASIDAIPEAEKKSDLIFVGRFIPEKHAELVVEAVHLLSDEGIQLSCIMIGDGPEFNAVRTLIQNYGLSDRIECTGFIADSAEVISLMKSSKIFILPSEREGFGIVAIEAMACGLALVTVNHPRNAASAHVLPGHGYLARMDASDVATGIKKCLQTSPDELLAVQYARKHDWDQIAVDLERYYLSLITSEKSVPYIKGIFPTGNDLNRYSEL